MWTIRLLNQEDEDLFLSTLGHKDIRVKNYTSPILGTYEGEVAVYTYIEFENKQYVTQMIDIKNKVAFVEPLIDFQGDTTEEDNWICPYCGYIDNDAWELGATSGDSCRCHYCNRDVHYVKECFELDGKMISSYSTYKTAEELELNS